MPGGTISSIIFALACIAAAYLSGRILGPGMWGWLMLGGGIFVAISPHLGPLREPGRVIATIAGILSTLAAVLTLLAATIGGSFKLPPDEAQLVTAFVIIAIAGFFRSRARSKPVADTTEN